MAFTQSELKEKELSKDKKVKQRALKEVKAPVEPKKEVEYILLYPENEINNYANFKDEIKIDGKVHERKCVNGLIKTKDKILADFLISQEHQLIQTLEGKNVRTH